MKKQIFTIILLLMGGVAAFGQFKLDGGINSLRLQTGGIDRMYITHSTAVAPLTPGNIGIGTTSPYAKLTVAGDMALQKIQRETSSGGYNNYDRQDASIAIFQNGGTITGIQGGSEGQLLYVLCGYGTNQSALIISHEGTGSTASNRILTHTGADFTVTGGAGGVLLIYDATKARWRIVETPSGSGTAGWGLTGNAGTNPATQFIGTTDAQDLVFRTNNIEKMRVASSGNIGIGIAPNANTKLFLSSGISGVTPGSATKTVIEDNVSHYLGLNSPDASETGVLFGKPTLGGASGGVIYTSGSDMNLRTGGNNTRVIIASNGNVGIGSTTPTAKLDVDGDIVVRKTTITTGGIINALNRGGGSSIKFDIGGTVTLNGIAGGVDGMLLYIINGNGTTLIINNENTGALAANRITTNTGSSLTITNRGGATLIYDSASNLWRVIGIAN